MIYGTTHYFFWQERERKIIKYITEDQKQP